MTTQHPPVEDAALGRLVRARIELTDGSVQLQDWYAGSIEHDGTTVELMIEGTTPEQITPLLPRLRNAVAQLSTLRRVASDAVVTNFSNGEPERHELDEAASDLVLDTIEASADGTIALHLLDTCGEHFPEGYWPAVHLGDEDQVTQVTVES